MQRSKKQVGLGTGVEVTKQEEMCREMAPVGLQEGAGGLSFTVVCIPKHNMGRFCEGELGILRISILCCSSHVRSRDKCNWEGKQSIGCKGMAMEALELALKKEMSP